ncbi:DUF4276 family protein [Lusitaniella coriacea LEGE 07157]|uniref:DUF4276 family protein n=1 Tax=Lusitaniella coriacea LEGE 07157 TaxID=945747 RepID=A0A8J7DWE2_9CYAN|nr:DUF4276 family protein [Lusitaniella coriacea]MBE9116371.1 DUF4276 family protein [Lusitaniella coriacea LEGE 07157]
MTISHLEVLVEEYSAEVALENLLPKILTSDLGFKIHSFRGKKDLLKKLPQRLKGYRSWLPEDWRIVVLCDRDDEDCQKLKKMLEDCAISNGVMTKSSSSNPQFTLLNRIAIEELEAWFLGDATAINQAYPKIAKSFANRERYRDPDVIRGGTWEALEALLQKKGYYQGGLNKVEVARTISEYMQPQNNRSLSFQCFYSGVQALTKQG